MKRCCLLGIVLLAVAVVPARAAFGLFRRQTEVRYYYAPPVYYVPAYRPIYYPVIEVAPPVVVSPAVPALPPPGIVVPSPGGVIPRATPTPAPPSTTAEPPMAPQGTTSLRPGERYFDLYSGATRMTSASDTNASVAFWNLTRQTVTLNVAGQTHVLAAGRSVTLDLPRSFTWQVPGRAAETTQITAGHSTAELLIRR